MADIPDPKPTECDHCGQLDTAPKAHFGSLTTSEVRTVHFDCTSVAEDRMLRDAGQPPANAARVVPKNSAVLDACKRDGIQNDELLALIQDPDALPQAEGLAEKAQLELEASQ